MVEAFLVDKAKQNKNDRIGQRYVEMKNAIWFPGQQKIYKYEDTVNVVFQNVVDTNFWKKKSLKSYHGKSSWQFYYQNCLLLQPFGKIIDFLTVYCRST